VAKLLKHLKGTFFLLTCDHSRSENLDFSMASYLDTVENNTVRIKDKSEGFAAKMLLNLIPAASQLPDDHLLWMRPIYKTAKRLKAEVRAKVIVAVSRPETDLLIGMRLKKLLGIPLIVYFSDPWADKPYPDDNRFLKWANLRMEGKVIKGADLVLFTNEDQQKLVMRKYPEHIQRKARSINHCFDEMLYPPSASTNDRFLIRHIGRFFKYRSPDPFIRAIHQLVKDNPKLESKLLVEFYGPLPAETLKTIRTHSLERIIKAKPSVPYLESLKLMASADLLLLVDTGSEENNFYNTFFPSKLADYMGAKRNILGIASENSPSARIIKLYGGLVFGHEEINRIKKSLYELTQHGGRFLPNRTELSKYSAESTAKEFERIAETIAN
jgi:glycosyltransferase involved in cell wall biosynthesis